MRVSARVARGAVAAALLVLLVLLVAPGADAREFEWQRAVQAPLAAVARHFRAQPAGDDDGGSACVNAGAYPDPCAYVLANCSDVAGVVNYLYMHYCVFEHVVPLSYILMVLWLVFLFYLLGATADDYFTPTLGRISQVLRLSHNVAGVTFLAFGNGAPDIFSSFAALNSSSPGIAFGALFGAGVFVTTVVVGGVCMAAPNALLTRRPLIRDILFYLITAILFVFLIRDQHVYAWEAGLCIGLYAAYVVLVVVARVVYQRLKKRRLAREGKPDPSVTVIEASVDASAESKAPVPTSDDTVAATAHADEQPTEALAARAMLQRDMRKQSLRNFLGDGEAPATASDAPASAHSPKAAATAGETLAAPAPRTPVGAKRVPLGERSPLLPHGSPSINADAQDLVDAPARTVDDDAGADGSGDDSASVESPVPATRAARIRRSIRNLTGWKERSRCSKVRFVFFAPTNFILRLTIPVAENDDYNRFYFCLHPIFSMLFMLFTAGVTTMPVGSAQFPLWAIIVIIGVPLCAALIATTRKGRPRYFVGFLIPGFVLSVAWVYVVANEVVALLNSLGIIVNISPTLLGLTVLAWGNSLGDLVADIAVAKRGFAGMGVGACIGGPFFNLLMGVGIACLYWTLRNGRAYVFAAQPDIYIAIIALGASLLFTLISISAHKFRLYRAHGGVLFALYVVFFVVSVLYQFHVINF